MKIANRSDLTFHQPNTSCIIFFAIKVFYYNYYLNVSLKIAIFATSLLGQI